LTGAGRTPRPQASLRRAAAALLAWALVACAQTGAEAPSLTGAATHWIDDPVFGGQVAVLEAGRRDARPILLVHGIGEAGASDFREQIAWLQDSFHVVAPDLPGFGASDKANALYSPANYAAVLRHIADQFLARPFTLMGHSMGGVVALRYAGTYPEDVEQLVVLDAPGVLHRVSTTGLYLESMGGSFVPSVLDQNGWVARLARRIAAPFARPVLEPQNVLASPRLRETVLGGEPANIAGLAVVNENLADALPGIRAPTLIVWGARDDVAPLRNGRVLAWRLPHARLVALEDVGHTPMLEAPGRLRALLEPFFASGRAPDRYRKEPLAEPRGEGRCASERGRLFEGEYERLTIEGCTRAVIRYARVRELRIVDSSVTIDDSVVGGGRIGLYARNASIVMTGGRIEGDTAIVASGSRLDLAAVELVGRETAVRAEDADAPGSSIVFSLSRAQSPRTQRELHEVYWLTPENAL
jgi:pimeloyl-ACP methyl ester carboxylesterase